MSEVEVRPARPEDRAAVLAFCEGTWDDGDYIAEVWDEWQEASDGALLVAVLDERPVGVVHARLVSEDESWLEGIRVDPAVRRRGIGRVLLSRALVASRERGAAVARLFTSADNTASQQLVAAFGFAQVAAFVDYAAPADASIHAEAVPAGAAVRTPGVADLEPLWAFLEASNLVPLNGGLLVADWTARALTAALLERRLAAGDVCLLEEWGAIQALAVTQPQSYAVDGPHLEVQYLDGSAEGVGRMALVLRGEAARRGLAKVRATIADALILHDAMAGGGYAQRGGQPLWCYARTL